MKSVVVLFDYFPEEGTKETIKGAEKGGD